MMQHTENTFAGSGGMIYYQYWTPEKSPRGLVLIAHGAAEHGGRYQHLADYLCERALAVAAVDHLGHGRSEGKRCCLTSFEQHVENLRSVQQILQAEFKDVPQVLLGHSMGGLIVAQYLLRHQAELSACALSGPAIMTELVPPWWQFQMIRLFSAILPDMGVLQLDASGVSRDPAEVERYQQDPLNYGGKLTARMVREMFRAMNEVHDRAAEISIPLMLMHGGADSMTAPKGSEFLHGAVASSDKELHIYPGLYHEIFNEPERQAIFEQLASWLDRQLPSQP